MAKRELSIDEIISYLSDLWAALSPDEQDMLRPHLSAQKYRKNEPIYSEGEIPAQLLCVLSGKVKIFKEGVGARNQIIRVLKPVEYFGYRAYFGGGPYVTQAAAFEPSVICSLPMDLIEKIAMTNTKVAMFFVRQLSTDLGIADERVVSLTQKHIRGRLAESILFLKESYGLEEDMSTLSVYLSREDLASLSNMTTSNAIRTLSAFAAEKLIAIDGRKIKILEEEKLKRISRIG